MTQGKTEAPPALVTLRAHPPAPARVELVYQPAAGRALRCVLSLLVCWALVPLLIWVPPHYPWALSALVAGAYLAYRSWTGRYYVRSFAGLCPRCGRPLSLGVDHLISLPHTLTCYGCHFEPQLEVRFVSGREAGGVEHFAPECIGLWGLRWLADEAYVVCDRCHAHCPATSQTRAAAEAENERGELLLRLTREGRPLL